MSKKKKTKNNKNTNKKTKNKSKKKQKKNDVDVMTEEEYEDYLMGLYDMDFIAGYTEGGVPYGTFNESEPIEVKKINQVYDDDDIPF